MVRIVWVLIGGAAGLVAGAMVGFVAALLAMSMSTPRNDGTFGMREVLVCVPSGAALGLVAGLVWRLRRANATIN